MKEIRLGKIAEPLLGWYRENARPLPWRETRDPYKILVSEVMLQQTRVEAVKDYYARFLEAFPAIGDLAAASDERLFGVWKGLGYYSRAKNLRRAAQEIAAAGAFPSTRAGLMTLPGVGGYTASAVASIAFGEDVPAVDGNALRVAARLAEIEEPIESPAVRRMVADALAAALPKGQAGDFNQALMDLGAVVCRPNGAPDCANCPLRDECEGERNGTASALPLRSEKRPRAEESLYVVLWERDGRIAVRRRADKGLLASLWEFPNYPVLPIGMRGAEEVARAKHVFTHKVWNMTLVRFSGTAAEEEEGVCFVEKERLVSEYPLPTAFARFLPYVFTKKSP